MASKTLLALTSLAAALALGLFLLRRDARGAAPELEAHTEPAPLALATPAQRAPTEPAPEREPAAAIPAVTPASAAVAAPVAELVDELVVRVLRAADRSPIADAGVRLQEVARPMEVAAQGLSVRTDGDGRARFPQSPHGTLLVHVDRVGPGRAFERVPGPQELEVLVPVGCTVAGRVVLDGGTPVADALVLAHGTMIEPDRVATSDADGRFTLVDVQPGIALEAASPGLGRSLAHPLVARAGARVELELVLPGAERRITGRVRAASGAPASGALVAALVLAAEPPTGDRPHARPIFTRADGQGSFALAAPALELLLVAAPAERDLDAPAALRIAAGEGEAALELVLNPGAELVGRVTRAGVPTSQAQVTAWPEEPDGDLGYLVNLLGMRTGTPDANGEYHLRGLLAGKYRLMALGADGSGRQAQRRIEAGEEARWDVELADGLTLVVNVELPLGVDVTAGTWSARLARLDGRGGSEFVGTTRLHGGPLRFDGLGAGDYQLVVESVLGSSFQCVGALVASPGAEEWNLRIEEAALPRAQVRGRLLDAHGKARAHEALHAFVAGEFVSLARAVTGAEGEFEFGPLVAGRWTLALGEREGPAFSVVQDLAPGEARELGELVVE